MQVYLDGKFIALEDARLSVHDAAVQHGVGLFETMRAWNGTVFRLDAHMQRLCSSAVELGLAERLEPEPLVEVVRKTLDANELGDARVRLTVTGGDMSLLSSRPGGEGGRQRGQQASIVVVPAEPTVYPDEFFTAGVTVVIADPKANPFDPTAGHKTLNYWVRLQTLARAAAVQAGEALWFTVVNQLYGGAVSNAFLVKDEQIITPIARGEESEGDLPSPVLPGITRAAVIEIAEQMNLPVHRRVLSINDVLEADEIMLTNSSWLVLPVVQVEREKIGEGEPGPITQRLREALLMAVARECGLDEAGD